MTDMKNGRIRYVVCIDNKRYPASLELRKIYAAHPDAEAERQGMLRVADESGEDYLYPERLFVPLTLPRRAARALALK